MRLRVAVTTALMLAAMSCDSKEPSNTDDAEEDDSSASPEEDCDTIYDSSGMSLQLMKFGLVPKDAKERDGLVEALEGAASKWKKAEKMVSNKRARKLGQVYADTFVERIKLLKAIDYDKKPAPPKPKDEPKPSGEEPSREEVLDLIANGAVEDMLGGPPISKGEREALDKNFKAAEAANEALSDWCLDNR